MRLRWNVEAFERISVRRASARALGRDSIFSLSDGYIHPIGFTFFFFLTGEGKEDHKNIPLSFFLPFFLSSYRGCFLLTKRFRLLLLLLLRLLLVTTAKHDQAGQRYLGDGRIQRHVRLPSRRRRG